MNEENFNFEPKPSTRERLIILVILLVPYAFAFVLLVAILWIGCMCATNISGYSPTLCDNIIDNFKTKRGN